MKYIALICVNDFRNWCICFFSFNRKKLKCNSEKEKKTEQNNWINWKLRRYALNKGNSTIGFRCFFSSSVVSSCFVCFTVYNRLLQNWTRTTRKEEIARAVVENKNCTHRHRVFSVSESWFVYRSFELQRTGFQMNISSSNSLESSIRAFYRFSAREIQYIYCIGDEVKWEAEWSEKNTHTLMHARTQAQTHRHANTNRWRNFSWIHFSPQEH